MFVSSEGSMQNSLKMIVVANQFRASRHDKEKSLAQTKGPLG